MYLNLTPAPETPGLESEGGKALNGKAGLFRSVVFGVGIGIQSGGVGYLRFGGWGQVFPHCSGFDALLLWDTGSQVLNCCGLQCVGTLLLCLLRSFGLRMR